jgi:hypothetical protein
MPAGPADRFSFFREVPVVTVVSSTELRPSATVVIILAEKESNSSVHPSSSVAKAFASSKTCSFVTFFTGVCWLVIQSSSTRFSPSPMRPFFEKTSAFFMKSVTVAKKSSRKATRTELARSPWYKISTGSIGFFNIK